MIKFDIHNRFTGAVQFTAEIECEETALRSVKIGLAVRWAIKNEADLREANLYGANLREANLRGADLYGANLYWADLREADLREANLYGANLYWANLREANLREANLYWANLREANLRGANLYWANLREANLRGADLSEANLRGANLSEANLYGADSISDRIIDGGIRSDGYRFLLTRTDPGPWRIKAGCRNFTLDEAREHWTRTRPEGDPLGDETRLIIAHMVAVAKLRKWPEGGEE